MLRLAVFGPLLLLALANNVADAQEPAATSAQQDDSLAAAGRRLGSALANNRAVGGRLALAFVGGLPVGFAGPLALGTHHAVPKLVVGVGVVVIGAAAVTGDAAPPQTLVDSVATHGPEFEEAFRKAYSNRLRERRNGSAFWGGVAGTATGAATFLLLLVSMSPGT